jgi:TRAP-type C4-dicarboxylate transport system permease small subunit
LTKVYIATVEALIIAGLSIMVALTFVSAMIRFVPGYGGIFWAEEVTRYISIWVVFLGSGLGVRYGIHLSVDIVTNMVARPLARVMTLVSLLFMVAFEVVLVWYGTVLAISNHAQQSASLGMPMSLPYAAIPVGSFIMLCETIRLIVRHGRGFEPQHAYVAD